MTTIDLGKHGPPTDDSSVSAEDAMRPAHERYHAAHHFVDKDHEFDAVKMGVWLFLATEILLFSGMFCAYAIFRMIHPEAFINGSHYLQTGPGLINTIILLMSSYWVAAAVRHAQTGNQKWLQINIALTFIAGAAFLFIKFVFEYMPKWADGKRPGAWFSYPGAADPHEPLWWGVYYGATAIHASHVIIGMGLLAWIFLRSRKGHFGPGHYNAVEGVGLYWHIVDIVWIFLFPLLYLIH